MSLDAVFLPRDFGRWEGPLGVREAGGFVCAARQPPASLGEPELPCGDAKAVPGEVADEGFPVFGGEAAGRRITETCGQQLIDIFFLFSWQRS